MKKTLAAAAVILSVTAAADAATVTPPSPPPPNTPSGRYLWKGELFIVSTEGMCTGLALGYSHRVIFEPNGWPYNSSKDRFMLFWGLNAAQWIPASGNSLSGKNTTVSLTSITAEGLQPVVSMPVIAFSALNLPAPPKGSQTIALGSTAVQLTFTRKQANCTFTQSGTLTGPF